METREWKTIKEYQDILFDFYNGIAKITINRPRYRNAFTPTTTSEISDALYYCRECQDINVVVLTGAGDKAFCSGGDKTPRAYGFDDYREQFLQQKLTGARRQTYIHDSLYKVLARVLPVIAPEMSVPTFVNSVLSDHLKRYQDIINGMYNREATQKPVEWEL